MNEAREHDHDLEDHIETLRELDKYRKESAKLREEGFKALDGWVREYNPSSSESPPTNNHQTPDSRQLALLIKAYSERLDWSKVERKTKIEGEISGGPELSLRHFPCLPALSSSSMNLIPCFGNAIPMTPAPGPCFPS